MPVQPRSPKQTGNRGLLTAGSSRWRTLTVAEQGAWNGYAAQFLYNDSLGSSYSPTGASMFSGSYIVTQGAAITDPPAVLPEYVLSGILVAYTDPTPGPEALTIAFDNDSADNVMIVETSGPASPGLTSAAGVRRWFTLPASASDPRPAYITMTSPAAILTNYKLLFPSPVPGNVIWFRVREIAFPGGSLAGIANKLKQTYRLPIP